MKPYFENEAAGIRLYHGKFEEVAPSLPDASFDACITDPPYGTTACAWDVVIPFDVMWSQLKRLVRSRGAIALFSSQPFTSALIMSNPALFKWEDIYEKSHPRGHLNAKVMPLRAHENIVVFCNGSVNYYPQIEKKDPLKIRPLSRRPATACYGKYNEFAERSIPLDMSYPRSIIRANVEGNSASGGGLHPTQKPVALMEYLVKTYTNEQETVLDFTTGSGSTLVAAYRTGRRATGIEREEKYCEIAARRIERELAQGRLFEPQATPEPPKQIALLGA